MVRTSEYRRLSIWKNLVSLVLGMVAGDEDQWSVLSVHSGAEVLARRRVENDTVADRVRSRFVALVTTMSDAEFERTNWQAVLDGIPTEGA